ncbi:hypothetical protein PSECIP111951_01140 [Pseudoalteromonas holothuriae]|uniref:Uncharacterized protein n=1 Tax=Pseudoalteromonas holothuriae TaxID=2963714 RepID=A0A9W4QXF6_9GAMM|nr:MULTISPECIES: hypothetical protein [unclassified Pseudoalteromonas]CAH9054934.1 hypothetical protein PSECIP111951_01140 [Pseudoalteromonas sp. CIP111951]CAH9057632.1 hypothetical protein PSECIP111854_02037 [Pseudoalteromonas sp. CIP111854]
MGLTALTQIAKAKISSETKSLVTKNKYSFTRQVRQLGQPQRWRIKLTTTPLPYQEAMAAYVQIASLDGVFEKTYLPNPLPAVGSAKLTYIAESLLTGESSVRIRVSAKGEGNAFAAGDFIQFAGHDKVYQVTGYNHDADIVHFYPKLKSNVSGNTQLSSGEQVQFLVYSDDDDTEMSISAGRPIPVSVELVEVIPS